MSFYSAFDAGKRYSDLLEDDTSGMTEWEQKLIEADMLRDAEKDRLLDDADMEMEIRADDLRI